MHLVSLFTPLLNCLTCLPAFDEANLILYCHISQIFRIQIFPFYAAPVALVTVLRLVHDKKSQKYYIKSQNDLYQVNEFVRFIWPGGFLLVWLWQIFCTGICVFGTFVLWPVTLIEEYVGAVRDRPGYGKPEESKIAEDDVSVPMGLIKDSVIRM